MFDRELFVSAAKLKKPSRFESSTQRIYSAVDRLEAVIDGRSLDKLGDSNLNAETPDLINENSLLRQRLMLMGNRLSGVIERMQKAIGEKTNG